MKGPISWPRRRLLLAGAGMAAFHSLGAPASPVQLAPLTLRRRVLANGLEFIALPNAGTGTGATVSVQVWYRVGSKDDPVGRSGFAHLFEHMMFKSTRHMANEQFDRMTEDVGGSNNAFTTEDSTAYHCVVPANHLEPVLWAEAERMSNLTVDQANFDSERAVVKEEYRQNVLSEPYGQLFNAVPSFGYQTHPYRRPVSGNIEELDAATLADVSEFHANYYRPDNAVLLVAGAFDARQLDEAVNHYFGSIPRPSRPIPRNNVVEARRVLDQTYRLPASQAPQPAALLIWQGPRADSPDAIVWQVAQALLSQGESARLSKGLVYNRQVAQSAGFEAQLNAEAGLLVAHAVAAGGTSAAALVAPLAREVQRLAEEPVAERELNKVKTQLMTAALIKRQTAQGLAELAGMAAMLRADAAAAERDLAALQAVSAADVQRVVRRDVQQAARVTLLYGPPASSKPALKPRRGRA
ncbi:insulinase family protein [Paucibacter sp. TC2R-5]|uniref:M16 family metallopeptidase n=1 Tax=Paucibacter sp. TC2R-5 TaxID=2893555 RepID=UPI0021E3FF66|nr:pitrilysin family protein [Paucibacter sp. TC2R-5]MCV2360778.1 insulinase family protein [Paucibacter sp. TC2R-5]